MDLGDELSAAGLTPREVEVALLIVQGQGNQAIADAMSITERTVKHHLGEIYSKLYLRTRLELAVYCFKLLHVGDASALRP